MDINVKFQKIIKKSFIKKLTNIALYSKKNIYKTDIIFLESGFEIDYFLKVNGKK